ncbi:MAG: hypothetical protein AVO33_09975 [delta proteobacterium ML8_F1]|nr:MAG: hypothetical protein AVO33_09975 [delta proteobacterium ML8_F1]
MLKGFRKIQQDIEAVGIIALVLVTTYLAMELKIFDRENLITWATQGSQASQIEVIFVLVGFLLLLVFVPISWVSAAAAIIFGLSGIRYLVLAATASALVAFCFARRYKDRFQAVFWEKYHRKKRKKDLEEIYEGLESHGFAYVLFLRTAPVVPYSLGNYIFGLSYVSFKDFALATLIALPLGQGINIYFFDKALRFGESPGDALVAAGIKGAYLLIIFLWSRRSRYGLDHETP